VVDGALVVVLVLLWAVVLLPSAIRSRRTSAHVTVGGFERAMDVLRNRPPGRELLVPRDAGRIVESYGSGVATAAPSGEQPRRDVSPRAEHRRYVLARRRQLFSRMLGATAVLFALAVIVQGAAWTLALLSFGVTVAYAAVLRRWKLQRDEAAEVVRTIRTTDRREAADRAQLAHAVGETPTFGELQVATRPDDPWQPRAGVRIRRWDG
jgi:hypothetical protein